ncbi:MAG: hypothetical protein J5I59_12725 [Saprospiraceae bacterium]|nr:hypothetical protein [Saprospiraceae bacterium]
MADTTNYTLWYKSSIFPLFIVRHTIHIEAHGIGSCGGDGYEIRFRVIFVAGGGRDDESC